MPSTLPPFHTLTAFEAVARHQSFARAAQELCLTNSAISHRIKILEQHLGVRCFVRSRGSVTLTAQGLQLLGGVIDAMSTLQIACSRTRNLGRKVVRLSVGPAFAKSWLLEKLGSFYPLHDDIDIEINAVKLAPAEKLACLSSGEADVAIRYGAKTDWPGFSCAKLLQSEVFPVCSRSYVAGAGPFEQPLKLLDATLLRLARQPWAPWFKAAGLTSDEPAQGPWFSDAGIMLDAAARGQGVALARSVLATFDLNAGRLVRLFDIGIRSESAYYAIRPRSAKVRPEIAAFTDWLVATARQEHL